MASTTDQKAGTTLVKALYHEEGCGICGKCGGDLWWCSPQSRLVHTSCYEKIKSSEARLLEYMTKRFEGDNHFHLNMAHTEAVRAVQAQCGDLTLADYVDQEGEGALSALFDTVGFNAVWSYGRRQYGLA